MFNINQTFSSLTLYEKNNEEQFLWYQKYFFKN